MLDTNVAIDFQEGNFLRPLFALPLQFIVPDVLLAGEYLSLDQSQLEEMGLSVLSMSGEQLVETVALRQQHPQLSVNDLMAYILARGLGAVLLTGDGRLRNLAIATNVACHGTLWLLDEIVNHQCATELETAQALQQMLACRRRLPQAECTARLRRWSGK